MSEPRTRSRNAARRLRAVIVLASTVTTSILCRQAHADADVLDGSTSASEPSSMSATSRDHVLVDAARLPDEGSVRARVGGEPIGARPLLSTSLLFVPVTGVALTAGVARMWLDGAKAIPLVGVRWQVATQSSLGVDLTSSVALRPAMMETGGSELEARLLAGRTFGRLALVASFALGQGLGERRDLDFEASTSAHVRVIGALAVGAEARARGELADRDLPNVGREYEAVTGPAVYWSPDRYFALDVLAGWQAPRGTTRTGPTALAYATVAF
jgi:hypothetical protein